VGGKLMVNKDKIILTDCDGVCLDWETAFSVWMSHNGMEPVGENPKLEYKVSKKYGITYQEGRAFTAQFNASAAIGFLPPLRDAQYYMKKLVEKHGYRFVAVTSLSSDPYAQQLRTANLKKLFGEDAFIEYHYLSCGADKDEILLELSAKYPGAPWVEDKYVNVDEGIKVGFEGYLIEHGHNLKYDGSAKVVKNWEEIYDAITEGS
jgi:hypothetical protein|tara:strand:+ start:260 stop:877 length:618 start_codon:yes stop_codon:yes gene_type:complete